MKNIIGIIPARTVLTRTVYQNSPNQNNFLFENSFQNIPLGKSCLKVSIRIISTRTCCPGFSVRGSDVPLELGAVNGFGWFFLWPRDGSGNWAENGFIFVYVLGQPAVQFKSGYWRKYDFGFYTPFDDP